METLETVVNNSVRLYLDLEPHGHGKFTFKPVWFNEKKSAERWSVEMGPFQAYGATLLEAAINLRTNMLSEAQQRVATLRTYF